MVTPTCTGSQVIDPGDNTCIELTCAADEIADTTVDPPECIARTTCRSDANKVVNATDDACIAQSACIGVANQVATTSGDCMQCGGSQVRSLTLDECLDSCPGSQLVPVGRDTCEIEKTCSGGDILIRASNTCVTLVTCTAGEVVDITNNMCITETACTDMSTRYISSGVCLECPMGQIRNSAGDGCGIPIAFFMAPATDGNFADSVNGGMDAHCRATATGSTTLTNAGYAPGKAFFYSPTNIRNLTQLFTGTATQGLALSNSEASSAVIELLVGTSLVAPTTSLAVNDFLSPTLALHLHSAVSAAMQQIGSFSVNDRIWLLAASDGIAYDSDHCMNGTSNMNVITAVIRVGVIMPSTEFSYFSSGRCNVSYPQFCLARK